MNKIKQYHINNQLITASIKGDLDLVKQLVEQGADIHFEENFPLICAIGNNHKDIVDFYKIYIKRRELNISLESSLNKSDKPHINVRKKI